MEHIGRMGLRVHRLQFLLDVNANDRPILHTNGHFGRRLRNADARALQRITVKYWLAEPWNDALAAQAARVVQPATFSRCFAVLWPGS